MKSSNFLTISSNYPHFFIVVFCMMTSMFVSGLVHRVCVTTWWVHIYKVFRALSSARQLYSCRDQCKQVSLLSISSFIFSSIALYYMNRLSNTKYAPIMKPAPITGGKKKGQ
jgi:hypothetical protein